MKELLKFGLLFLLCALILSGLMQYAQTVFNIFGSAVTYGTTGNVGIVLTTIISFFGWFFDLIFIGGNVDLVTTYGAFAVNISWVVTILQVVFGFVVLSIILSLIFNRG